MLKKQVIMIENVMVVYIVQAPDILTFNIIIHNDVFTYSHWYVVW